MKRFLLLGIGVALILSAGACKKKEEKPVPQAPNKAPSFHGGAMFKGETKVIVPDNVKGRWKAVKILFEDRAEKKNTEYTIDLDSDFKVPGTDLKISVGEFLPDFRMSAGTITSASNEPNNSAVHVKVFEGEKEIFSGWLFAKFPTAHPFEHNRYGIILKEGIEKKG
jgi:Uncharacterized protein conserved in bacteria (DUF2155)